jgi:hypothetical protein
MVDFLDGNEKVTVQSRDGIRPWFELVAAVAWFSTGFLVYLRHGDGCYCSCSDGRRRPSLLKVPTTTIEIPRVTLLTTSDGLQVPKSSVRHVAELPQFAQALEGGFLGL